MDNETTLPATLEPTPLESEPAREQTGTTLSRGKLLKAALRFNLKLALESAKDIFLAPLSIAAAVLGLILPARHAAMPLKFVLRTGHRFDDAIDLYTLKELDSIDPRALPAADDLPADTPPTDIPAD